MKKIIFIVLFIFSNFNGQQIPETHKSSKQSIAGFIQIGKIILGSCLVMVNVSRSIPRILSKLNYSGFDLTHNNTLTDMDLLGNFYVGCFLIQNGRKKLRKLNDPSDNKIKPAAMQEQKIATYYRNAKKIIFSGINTISGIKLFICAVQKSSTLITSDNIALDSIDVCDAALHALIGYWFLVDGVKELTKQIDKKFPKKESINDTKK